MQCFKTLRRGNRTRFYGDCLPTCRYASFATCGHKAGARAGFIEKNLRKPIIPILLWSLKRAGDGYIYVVIEHPEHAGCAYGVSADAVCDGNAAASGCGA